MKQQPIRLSEPHWWIRSVVLSNFSDVSDTFLPNITTSVTRGLSKFGGNKGIDLL